MDTTTTKIPTGTPVTDPAAPSQPIPESEVYYPISTQETEALKEMSFKLLSDYSILRGQFLKHPNNKDDPNTRVFSQAGLLDSYMDLIRFQERLSRYSKYGIISSEAGAEIMTQSDRAKDFAKFVSFKNQYESQVADITALRERLEGMHKNKKGVFAYKPGIKFQVIGNPQIEQVEHDKSKRKATPSKRKAVGMDDKNDVDSETNARKAKKRRADYGESGFETVISTN